MATPIEITEEHTPSLYDSATGESIAAEKVIDVSDDCPAPSERVLLLYCRAQRGQIVQVAYPYPGEAYMGAHIHFFINEPPCESFAGTARRLGFTETGFRRLILAHAPAA